MALSRVERFVVLLLRLVSRACLAVLGLLPAPAPPRAASPAPARAVPPPRSALLLLPARELARRLRLRQVRGGVRVMRGVGVTPAVRTPRGPR